MKITGSGSRIDSEQQAVGARGRGGANDSESRRVREQRFETLGVMLRRMNAAAMGRANDNGAGETPARAVAHARQVIDDLIHRGIDEAHELNFGDRLQALDRHADRHAGDHALRERRVLHAILAEFFLQALRRAKDAAVDADVFAQHDDCRVVRHLPGMGQGNGFDHGYFCHWANVPLVAAAVGGAVQARLLALFLEIRRACARTDSRTCDSTAGFGMLR